MTKSPTFSVIIPAHNEETVIGRCLDTLQSGAPSDHAMEIIVVANGCGDLTVEVAKKAAPTAKIIDLPEGSKTSAINAGNSVARHFPRIILDADVECDFATAAAMAEVLTAPGVMTAAPAISLNLEGASWPIEGYYRAWLRQPYARAGKGGAGCYGLSRAAFDVIGSFPDIIADDIWIHTRFPDEQKRYLQQDEQGNPVRTVVYPPRTAVEQIRVEARRQLGNAQVLALHPSAHNVMPGGPGGLGAALRNGASPFDLLCFFGIKLAARMFARWKHWRGSDHTWSRDLSSRQL